MNSKPFVDENGTVLYKGVDLATADAATLSSLEDQGILFNVGKGLQENVVIGGPELVGTGDNNLFKVLDDLVDVLKNGGTGEEISPFIDALQEKQNDILSITAEIGGRINRMDMLSSRYESDLLNYETIISEIEDVDMTEAIVNYRMAEASYQAALSANSKIVLPTLADFMA